MHVPVVNVRACILAPACVAAATARFMLMLARVYTHMHVQVHAYVCILAPARLAAATARFMLARVARARLARFSSALRPRGPRRCEIESRVGAQPACALVCNDACMQARVRVAVWQARMCTCVCACADDARSRGGSE